MFLDLHLDRRESLTKVSERFNLNGLTIVDTDKHLSMHHIIQILRRCGRPLKLTLGLLTKYFFKSQN